MQDTEQQPMEASGLSIPSGVQEIAHLGHVELLTPKPEESLSFFQDIFGLDVVERAGQSVYLRAWGDYDRVTLKLTEAPQAGLGHVGWRTTSTAALQRRARLLATRTEGHWIEGDLGHGAAFQFTDPDGHLMEIYYESEKYRSTPETRSQLYNLPQKYVPRGAAVRRLDHVNLMCSDITPNRLFLQETLGFKLRELLQPEVDGSEDGAWLSVTPLMHDIAYVRDFHGQRGRFHHVAYWVDSRDEVLRAADVFTENQIFIEAGPAKHNISQAFYLYCYEPGGNRVELYNGSYLIMAPDWEPVVWRKAERGRGVYWGGTLPESFKTHGTPEHKG
jgi:catechol 2,3-dioxygenase